MIMDARGPGGLVLHEAGFDPTRLDLTGGPAAWTSLPAMGLRDFADEKLRGDDAARICFILDAPGRTTTRAAAALAIARYLLTQDRSVAVVDGDDQQPDLSGWAGREETEGWVDVVRYGISPRAASVPLPWGPQDGRVMGVGSYHPVRAEPDEAAALCERLLEDHDTVLICASTGDRGAYWAGVPALRLICWDRGQVTADETAILIRDTADLGAPLDATIAFGVSRRDAALEEGDVFAVETDETPRRSSPFFRRLAISLTVLVVVLGSWILGQLSRDDAPNVDLPDPGIAVAPEQAPIDSAVIGGAAVEGAAADTTDRVPADDLRTAAADTDVPAVDDDETAGTVTADAAPVATEPAPAVDPDAEPDAVDWRAPVGEDAYCLHVYSMADSVMAREQMTWMARRGVEGMVRRWRDDNGKVWYRIYAGSFATVSEARAAMDDLFEKLDHDWALPKRTSNLR